MLRSQFLARGARAVASTALGIAAIGAPRFVRSAELTPIRIGLNNIIPDAPFLIADRKGFLREEGLQAVFSRFGSSSQMVVPLSTNQLDVGGGSPVAQLYNAAARHLGLKLVADRGSDPPGYGYNPLLVRSELIKSGRYRTPRDLKGLTVANNGPGSVSSSTLNALLEKHGLKLSDIKRVYIDYPEHIAALSNGKIDASLTAEPSATQAERMGVAKRVMGNDQWYPYEQISVVLFGDSVLKNRDLGERFMRAYIRAARFYYGALRASRISGPGANEVVAILKESTPIKDTSILRSMVPSAINPDGKLYVSSLKRDFEFYQSQGLIEGSVRLEDVVDESFVDKALAKLGPYKGHLATAKG
jgi:NitT/TauT family transport system substrate-binding protein